MYILFVFIYMNYYNYNYNFLSREEISIYYALIRKNI